MTGPHNNSVRTGSNALLKWIHPCRARALSTWAANYALHPVGEHHGAPYFGSKALKPGISTSKARWISHPVAMMMMRIEPQRITTF